ncbi:MAG TPA: phosphate signaling complex protein PhoU [Oligoflexia bacterium]|nr:phosphate signaling complex protein PhoU [Oligoflexia bacterium]
MERHFDIELRSLKNELIKMAGFVEQSVAYAVEAIRAQDPNIAQTKFKQIFEVERKVNQAHKDVDDACVKLLALQQPLAADLRLIVAIIKMNSDLERMGDQAVNIAHNSERFLKLEPKQTMEDLVVMGDEVRTMVRGALDCFINRDGEMARKILALDDSIDEARNRIFSEMKTYLKTHPENIEHGFNVIFIARNLERIGDHATNIAEDVVFAITGEDIRHGGSKGV